MEELGDWGRGGHGTPVFFDHDDHSKEIQPRSGGRYCSPG